MKQVRFWEVDFLRGIAIVMMIIFHFVFDLNYFGLYLVSVSSGFWKYFGLIIPIMFLILVGVSLALSFARAKGQNLPNLWRKYAWRGAKVFSWGLIITLITWLFLREGFVRFGILHLIGLSIVLAYPFLQLRVANLVMGTIFIVVGLYLQRFAFDFPWLLWLGFMPEPFYSLDYFPLLPWFGVILIGLFFGNLLYPNLHRIFSLKNYSPILFVRVFCLLGRYSLLIYLVHQPLLALLLKSFSLVY